MQAGLSPAFPMPFPEKILVALSGGVDSSVAALLLREAGHAVAGAYMKNWINEDGVIGDCPWEEDIADARRSAERIGIDFQVVNLMRDYRERIVQYLLDGYAQGLTPNPDVRCNREIKFGVFGAWARDQGYDAVATGHYARKDGDQLYEGADKNKDQSYFLALLAPAQIRAARFPLGGLTKPEVRRRAREAGLGNAGKKDSQGICFIGEVKMADFLRAHVPDRPGPIVRAGDGRELGRHRGLHYYTLGHRKGIGVPSNTDRQAYVVVGPRAADHALLVAFDQPDAPGLFQREIRVHGLSWTGEPVTTARPLEGRVRYRDPRVPLEFIPEGPGHRPRPLRGAPARARERPDPRPLRGRAPARGRRLSLNRRWPHSVPGRHLTRRAERESLRPDLGRAVRCTLAFMAPLLLAAAGRLPVEAVFAALAAQNVAMPDIRGAYALRFSLLLAVTAILAACAGLGGLLAPHLFLAVAAMAVVAAAGGLWRQLSSDYGPTVAVSSTLMYAYGLAGLGGPLAARNHLLATLAGGLWGVLLQVSFWPFRPQHPLRRAVSDSWLAVGDLFAAMASDPPVPAAQRHQRMAEAEAALRTVLDQTYEALALGGAARQTTWLQRLGELQGAAARLASQVGALNTALEGLPPSDAARLAPPWQTVLTTLTNTARTVALAVVSRQPGHLAACEVRLRRLNLLLQALQSRVPPAAAVPIGDLVALIEAHLAVIGRDLRATIDRAGERSATSLELFDLNVWTMRPLASALNFGGRLDPMLVRYSARIAVLTMLGVLAFKGWGLPHGYWLPFTMVVVLQPDYGATRLKAAQRMLGTLAGSVLASLLLLLHLPFAAIMTAIAVACFIFIYFLKRNYGVAVVFITLFVVLLTESSGHVQLSFTLERLASTLAGGLLALFAALVFWPMWERERFPPLLAQALRANSGYLQLLARHLAAGEPYNAAAIQAKRRAESANSMVFSSLQRMMGDPKNRQEGLAQAAALANGNQRLTRSFNLVSLHLAPPAPAVGREQTAIAEQARATLDEIARRLDGEPGGDARHPRGGPAGPRSRAPARPVGAGGRYRRASARLDGSPVRPRRHRTYRDAFGGFGVARFASTFLRASRPFPLRQEISITGTLFRRLNFASQALASGRSILLAATRRGFLRSAASYSPSSWRSSL